MKTEIETIKNILSNPDYILTTDDIETQTVLLALKAQPRSKYKARDYQYEYEDKIIPPAYQPSKEEINLAAARYAMENNVWEIVYYMRMHIETLNGKEPSFPYTKESIQKSYDNSLKNWDEALEKWDDDNEMWECLVNMEWFNKVYVEPLSDMHSGDCTAFACTCSRCNAEQVFKIPHTANWSKNEGYKIYHQYINKIPLKNDLIDNSKKTAKIKI